MSNHHLPYSDSDTEFLERQQALSANPTCQVNNMTRVERARLRMLIEDPHRIDRSPVTTLVQSLIVTLVWAAVGIACAGIGLWSLRHRAVRLFDDYGVILAVVGFLTAGVVAVTCGMVR